MNSYIEELMQLLPEIFSGIRDFEDLNEIRVRIDKYPIFVYRKKKVFGRNSISKSLFDRIILSLCGGNLYKHESTMLDGYFIDIFGARCGVGCRVLKINDIIKVDYIHSLNIRIPRYIHNAAVGLYKYMIGQPFGGAVVFSKPGVGKTTYIRSLAGLFSEDGVCVCVVDERGEFDSNDYGEKCNLDIITGYRKWQGIDIAVRTLSPEIIICDELGACDRNDALYDLSCSGIRLIATVHSESYEQLKSKNWFIRAVTLGVFRYYVFLYKDINGNIHEEIEKICLS